MFMNFVPEAMGDIGKAFDRASKAQREVGGERVLRTLRSASPVPDKVFVFSSKAWESLPQLREETGGGHLQRIEVERATFQWGTYEAQGKMVPIIGLRHPLFASKETISAAVREAMLIPAQQ
jgi:hypothetical protein